MSRTQVQSVNGDPDPKGADATPFVSTAFEHVRTALQAEFAGRVPVETVDACFDDEVAKLRDARITAYLPILIHRHARASLREIVALASGSSPMEEDLWP